MDADRREIADGGLFARDGVIEAVGPTSGLPQSADVVIDARDPVVFPGLVNTHHHMVQMLTRAVRPAQDVSLFGWLQTLYRLWARLTPQMLITSAWWQWQHCCSQAAPPAATACTCFRTAPGWTTPCTPRSRWACASCRARQHETGQPRGGLPPDSVVDDEAAILTDTQRCIERWHDPARYAMQRVAVAPCSPFRSSAN